MRLGLRNASCPLFLFSGTKMALKFLRKKTTKLKSFLREYSVSLYLSPCPFIINMYGIAFETDEYYIFAQEYALAGDLFDIIPPQVRWRIKTWVHGDYFYRWIQTGSTTVLFGAWHLVVGSVGSQNTKIHQTFIVKCYQNKSTERSHQGSLTWQHFFMYVCFCSSTQGVGFLVFVFKLVQTQSCKSDLQCWWRVRHSTEQNNENISPGRVTRFHIWENIFWKICMYIFLLFSFTNAKHFLMFENVLTIF